MAVERRAGLGSILFLWHLRANFALFFFCATRCQPGHPGFFPPEKRTFTQTVSSRVSLSQAGRRSLSRKRACAPPCVHVPASARCCACTCARARLRRRSASPRLAWLCAGGSPVLFFSSRFMPLSLLSMPRRSVTPCWKAMRSYSDGGACRRISHTSSSAGASSLRPRGEASGLPWPGQSCCPLPSPPQAGAASAPLTLPFWWSSLNWSGSWTSSGDHEALHAQCGGLGGAPG